MDTVREFANAMQGSEDKPRTVKALVAEMLWAIAHDLNPKRPGRSERSEEHTSELQSRP